MTLRNFAAMMSDPNEIDQIYVVDSNDDVIRAFSYYKEKTVEELIDNLFDSWCPPDDEELEMYCEEFNAFRPYLDSEVVQVNMLDRFVFIKAL